MELNAVEISHANGQSVMNFSIKVKINNDLDMSSVNTEVIDNDTVKVKLKEKNLKEKYFKADISLYYEKENPNDDDLVLYSLFKKVITRDIEDDYIHFVSKVQTRDYRLSLAKSVKHIMENKGIDLKVAYGPIMISNAKLTTNKNRDVFVSKSKTL